VLIATQVLSKKNLEMTKTHRNPFFVRVEGKDRKGKGGGGFVMIFGLDGRPLWEPLGKVEEGILTAEVDMAMIDLAKQASLLGYGVLRGDVDMCRRLMLGALFEAGSVELVG
jgi:hypothetical protein